ncbi:hypothetical protein ACIPUC_12680 [Streptomyces sp. LARHCF249]
MMRWHLTTPKLADELRGNSMRPYAHHWYAENCRLADRIIVLDSGKIVEHGPFEQLVTLNGGRFRELYEPSQDR